MDLNVLLPEGSGWTLIEAKGPESEITLTSIGYTLSLRELYEKARMGSENAGAGAS